MSLKHMILGSIKEFPAHGYEMIRMIFRDFAEQGPGVNSGQLYTLLGRMEMEGLIEREVVHQDKAPSRKIIKITPEGEREFERWLHSDLAEIEYTRYDFFHKYGFLYKVNHFNKLSPEEQLAKVNQQLSQMEEKLANFLIAEADMMKRGVDRFRIMILQYGIEIQQTKIAWLRRLRDMVREELASTPVE
ncbi:MAG: helix-turn-helix transcriptional regulator [Syntrophomonadaceae bacterium]|nr:helix-turn-helix transcriptional regulator [Syntrophomonadaceae bacterium]